MAALGGRTISQIEVRAGAGLSTPRPLEVVVVCDGLADASYQRLCLPSMFPSAGALGATPARSGERSGMPVLAFFGDAKRVGSGSHIHAEA